LVTVTAIALLSFAGPMIPKAMAQSNSDLAALQAIANSWWYHGYIEAGGRAFLNNPQKNGVASQGGSSLAKWYEYRDIKPGAFGNFDLSTGTNNGLYLIDVWGENPGYDDQHYELNASKAGEHYFNFIWDETPHVYSNSAQTIYNGVGSDHLTLPSGLSATLYANSGNGANPTSAAQRAAIQNTLNANEHQTDIGIRRDTAAADWRWTPNTAWDVRADYSHMHRWGTQVDGVVFSPGTSGVVSQVTKPVDDTTQNFGVNGEYQGTSPWGQMFTFKIGYQGSVYQDASDSYLVDNPFCASSTGPCARTGSLSQPTALMSLWPDNQANGFSATLGANLPFKSRYMGTVSYNMMRQNSNFLPFTVGTNTIAGGIPALPAASLNGQINTLLSNNVVTTQITPELKSKLSYRYYDFDNSTPELFFSDWVLTDSERASAANAAYVNTHSISISYIKQNAAADLDWRPDRHWNLGVGYGFERYDWTRADANMTNENSVKAFVDWKPVVWTTARASGFYSQRRYDNYDYLGYVGNFQWMNGGSTQYSTAMRQFYLDNRDRSKGQFSLAVDVLHGLTVTPNFGYQDDVYDIPYGQVGLTRSQVWRAGVEVAYMLDPRTSLLFSYLNEQYNQNLRATTSATVPPPAANTYSTAIKDNVNTFVGTINYAAIPDTLDLKLSYSVSFAKDSQPVVFDNGTTPAVANGGQYPDVKNTWQRLEASAKYTFDKDAVRNAGIKGEMYAKLQYVWERNSSENWQNDIMQTYMAAYNTGYSYMTWLAYDNPNYDVQMIIASIGFKW
jgi:MtrB/PioB family decaheme-associated outer membrane protein